MVYPFILWLNTSLLFLIGILSRVYLSLDSCLQLGTILYSGFFIGFRAVCKPGNFFVNKRFSIAHFPICYTKIVQFWKNILETFHLHTHYLTDWQLLIQLAVVSVMQFAYGSCTFGKNYYASRQLIKHLFSFVPGRRILTR